MSSRNTNIDLAEIVAADIDHHFHPFTDHKAFHSEGGPRVITHAEGVWIWDANGNKYLDGMAGLWCVNVGYGRKELAEAAYRQMLDLPYYNTFFKTTTVPATELAAKISIRPAQALPAHLLHQFRLGSQRHHRALRAPLLEAEGQALPQALHWPPPRLSRLDHGCGIASAAWTACTSRRLPLPGFHHVQQPYWYDFGGDKTPEEFGLEAAGGAREEDPRSRARQCRRLHRRADPGGRRRAHSADDLLAGSRSASAANTAS